MTMKQVSLLKIRLTPTALQRIGRAHDDGPGTPKPGAGVSNILLEDGRNLLWEDGGVVLMETEVVKQLNL